MTFQKCTGHVCTTQYFKDGIKKEEQKGWRRKDTWPNINERMIAQIKLGIGLWEGWSFQGNVEVFNVLSMKYSLKQHKDFISLVSLSLKCLPNSTLEKANNFWSAAFLPKVSTSEIWKHSIQVRFVKAAYCKHRQNSLRHSIKGTRETVDSSPFKGCKKVPLNGFCSWNCAS